PCAGEKDPQQTQDRSTRAALERLLEPDELLCLGFQRRTPIVLDLAPDLRHQDPLAPRGVPRCGDAAHPGFPDSAFTRVHSRSKTGVNALNDALCAGMSRVCCNLSH